MPRWDRMSRSEQISMQGKLLRATARQLAAFSPHYKEKFRELKIDPDSLRSVGDIRKIPFVSKADIAPTLEDRARPRRFILQPDEEGIKKHYPDKGRLLKLLLTGGKAKVRAAMEWEYRPVHIHFTTGRTALPTSFVYSKRDVERLAEGGRRLFEVFGMRQDDVMLNVFPYAPHLAFWQAFWGGYQVGVTALQTGGGKIMGTDRIGIAAELMKSSVITVMPGYAYHLFRNMAEQGRKLDSVRFCVFGGERVPPGLRSKVKALLINMGAKDPRVLATYAFTECRTAWGECAESGTGYHTYPDFELIEIVDPKTGEPVGEGERGEIVYTALDWRGTSVMRFRTGDIAAKGISYSACPNCGRTVPRVDSNITRVSEVKEFRLDKVKGTLVDLNALFPMLAGMPGVLEWQVEIRKHNNDPLDLDEVVVHVATPPGVPWDSLEAKIREEMVRTMEIAPNEVRRRELPELIASLGMETELKEKRVIDNRAK